MAKLDEAEKHILVAALLAMLGECPPEEQPGVEAIIASISQKLSLADTIAWMAGVYKATRGEAEPAK